MPVADRQWIELEAGAKRKRIALAIADLMSRQARGQARNIILIEDLHWADSASLATLESVKSELAGRSFFFLVTTRDPDAQHSCGLARSGAVVLRLEPLASDAAERVLDGLLGRSPTLLRVKGRLLELGGGTPLFLQQLVQWLADSRALVGSPGNYRLAIHADQLNLPPSLQSATLWRVDRLPTQAREVLSLAAVLQQDIGVPAIAFMSGLDQRPSAIGARPLVERGRSFASPARTRRASRSAIASCAKWSTKLLTHDRRVELHGQALAFLETVPADGHAHRDNLLSTHAYACQNWAAVARYSQVVGERAIAASAYREAASHFEHAIDALYRLPRDRQVLEAAIDARLQARVCYSAMAKHDLCLAHIERAERSRARVGDDRRMLGCTIYRAGVLNFTGPVRELLSLGSGGAGQSGGPRQRGAHRHRRLRAWPSRITPPATIARLSPPSRPAARRLTGELAMIRLGTTGTAAAMCAALQAAAHAQLGEFDDASACLARVNAIARQTDRPYDIISHGYAEGITHSQQGNLGAAITSFERALSTCRAADIETFVTTFAGQLGQAYIASRPHR